MELDSINFNIYLPEDTECTPSLRAEKVSSDHTDLLIRVAKSWERVAEEKAMSATLVMEECRLDDCALISGAVAESLSRFSFYDFLGMEAYVCKDLRDQPQAFAILSKREDDLYLEYLVTNPLNIASLESPYADGRVKGAGSCLLKEAEKRAMDLGKRTVSLCPLDSAVTFYEKHGYAFHNRWGMSKEVTKIAGVASATLAA